MQMSICDLGYFGLYLLNKMLHPMGSLPLLRQSENLYQHDLHVH